MSFKIFLIDTILLERDLLKTFPDDKLLDALEYAQDKALDYCTDLKRPIIEWLDDKRCMFHTDVDYDIMLQIKRNESLFMK